MTEMFTAAQAQSLMEAGHDMCRAAWSPSDGGTAAGPMMDASGAGEGAGDADNGGD